MCCFLWTEVAEQGGHWRIQRRWCRMPLRLPVNRVPNWLGVLKGWLIIASLLIELGLLGLLNCLLEVLREGQHQVCRLKGFICECFLSMII